MFELYQFNEIDIIGFALTLIRVSSCLVVLPIFGSAQVPRTVKVLLSLAITLVLFPVVRPLISREGLASHEIILLAGREALVGAFLGFISRLLFIGVSVAGQIVGFSTGLSTASLINPATSEGSAVMEQLYVILAILLFLGVDAHHIFLAALHKSFGLIQVGQVSVNVENMANVSVLTQKVFIIGLQMAGPLMAVICFLNIAMGIIGRAVTQVNVFVVSFPINFLVGIFVLIMSLPLMVEVLNMHFHELGADLFKFMKNF